MSKIIFIDADVKEMIERGNNICKKIKKLFPDYTWKEVSNIFTELKAIGRVFYSLKNQDVELIRMLEQYDEEAILQSLTDSPRFSDKGISKTIR